MADYKFEIYCKNEISERSKGVYAIVVDEYKDVESILVKFNGINLTKLINNVEYYLTDIMKSSLLKNDRYGLALFNLKRRKVHISGYLDNQWLIKSEDVSYWFNALRPITNIENLFKSLYVVSGIINELSILNEVLDETDNLVYATTTVKMFIPPEYDPERVL